VAKARKLVMLALVLSAAANVAQALRLSSLERAAEEIVTRHQLAPGTVVPPFTTFSLHGPRIDVVREESDRPLLLYWMSPDCSWCARNDASFRVLAKAVRESHDVFVLTATLEGMPSQSSADAALFRVGGPPPPDAVQAYRLGSTPTTILLSPNRRVLRVWQGAYQGRNRTEIEEHFGVALPDIDAAER